MSKKLQETFDISELAAHTQGMVMAMLATAEGYVPSLHFVQSPYQGMHGTGLKIRRHKADSSTRCYVMYYVIPNSKE